jgi:peptidyl-prolyl cis-trans isomerase D
MLRGLRKASSNWLGKVVMAAVVGFLIISFGIWGIGDIFRNGFGVSTVARVGRAELSIEQFRNRYNEQLQQFSRQIGRPITPGVARAMGLEQQVLNQTIGDMALDEHARQLRLGLSDDEVAKQITTNPAFNGPSGQFDQATFLYRLREAGFTEQRFVSELRRDVLRRQITGAIGTATPPKVMASVVENFRGEERTIDYLQFDTSKVGEIPAPTPEELASYFEAHKFAFRAPEYRQIQLLTVSQQDIASTIEVSEEDAKRIYQDRLKQFGTPERRQVSQISFASADDAKRASERLKGGLSFDDLAKEPEIAGKLVDLGTVAKSDIIDPAVANAAFGLADGEVSNPVTGRFGTVLLRVTKIEPASTKAFADVEADLKRDIANERAKDEVNKIRDKVEEELGGGTALDEIAHKFNLKLLTIDAVDRSGRTPEGTQVAGLPTGVDVINSAFNADIGGENDALQLPAGGFVWYNVVNITPSRERPLDEVKDKVESRLRDDEITKRLDAKTADLVGKLNSGTSLADVAAAEGLKVATQSGMKRQGGPQMPPRVNTEVFRLAKDQVGSAEGSKPTERIIFRITDIKVPEFDANSAATAKVLDQLKEPWNADIMNQYIVQLGTDLGTDINQNALAQAVGRAGSDETGY